jgi:hypothetical protein
MAVVIIECPDCRHVFQSLVMSGTMQPKEWVCSKCGGRNAVPVGESAYRHPLEQEHGSGCPCCGG